MAKKGITTSSIRVDSESWYKFKVWCFKHGISMSEKLDEIIKSFIDDNGNK